jgi:hypothetical protein
MDERGKGRLNCDTWNCQKEMNKKLQTQYAAVLDTLKAYGCISEYSIIEDDVNLEWKDGGIDRVVREITNNPKPFGLKRSQRGLLMLVLPKKDRERADTILLPAFKPPQNR